MNDVLFVQIPDAFGEFACKSPRDVLSQYLVVPVRHMSLQISSLTVIRDHVDVLSCFEDFKHFDDMAVSAFVEDRSFMFELRNFLIRQLGLAHDLDGNFSLGYLVRRAQDIAVGTFRDRFISEFVLIFLEFEALSS